MEEQEPTWRQVKHLRLLGSHTFLLPFSETSLIMYSFLIVVTTSETTNSGRSAGQLLVKGSAPWLCQNGEGLWGLTAITCPHLVCIGSISWLQRTGFYWFVDCYSLLNLNGFCLFFLLIPWREENRYDPIRCSFWCIKNAQVPCGCVSLMHSG